MSLLFCWLDALRRVRVGGLSVVAGLMVALLGSSVADAELKYAVSVHGVEYVRDTDAPRGAPKGIDAVVIENGTTFNVTYDDVGDGLGVGFDHATLGAERRARMEDSLRYIAIVLNETGELDVLVEASETAGNGFLASAGTLFGNDTAFSNGAAFDTLRGGPNELGEEIFVKVDFGWTWYSGTGTPGFGEFDLQSVLTHEITHGLGIINLSNATGNNGFSPILPNMFSVWESFIERSGGTDLWALNLTLADFVGLAGDLTSDDLVFVGPEAVTAFGSAPPIHAPGSYVAGSSIGHFKLGIEGGALMEPQFSPGEVTREYSAVEIAALVDLGWTNADFPPGPGVEITGQSGPEFFIEATESASFSVTTSGVEGVATFVWRKDGSPISDGSGDGIGTVSGASTASLTIDNLNTSASGSYVLEINDEAKSQVFSEPFIIEVAAVGGLPVAGLVGLGLLAGIFFLGGTVAIRRRR